MTKKNQAIQYALDGNWNAAITINKDLVKENPEDIDALNRLALAYTIIGKINLAKGSYQKVIKIDPLNSIAIRNLTKLKDKKLKPQNLNYQINNAFLEEPGKTKVIELINIAEPRIAEGLRISQSLVLSIKRLKVFALNDNQYLGVVPDDIGKRLIKFMKSGCSYQAFVKSASAHKITIFIKEIKRTARYKDLPSFLSNSESGFIVSKSLRKNLEAEDTDEEDNNSYPEE